MNRIVRPIAVLSVAVVITVALSACNDPVLNKIQGYVRATETPTYVIEKAEPTAAPIGEQDDNDPALVNDEGYTAETARQRLIDYIGGSGRLTAEYSSTVTVPDEAFRDGATYYIFKVMNNGEVMDDYYVIADRYAEGLYKSSDFRDKYINGAEDAYTVNDAQADLLASLGNAAGITADYMTSVTVDEPDYSGDVVYYRFNVKQGGVHIEDQYVRVTRFGGVILHETEFNEE